MLSPVWTPPEDNSENQKPTARMPQQKQRRALGSPMVDITNKHAGASPRESPKKPAGTLRHRSSSRTSADVNSIRTVYGRQQELAQTKPTSQRTLHTQLISLPPVEVVDVRDELVQLEVQPQLPAELVDPAPVDRDALDPVVTRKTAQRILKDRAQMHAQAKIEHDEKTPCATQVRDVLDVVLWTCAILAWSHTQLERRPTAPARRG